jgi:hypothetical protein
VAAAATAVPAAPAAGCARRQKSSRTRDVEERRFPVQQRREERGAQPLRQAVVDQAEERAADGGKAGKADGARRQGAQVAGQRGRDGAAAARGGGGADGEERAAHEMRQRQLAGRGRQHEDDGDCNQRPVGRHQRRQLCAQLAQPARRRQLRVAGAAAVR